MCIIEINSGRLPQWPSGEGSFGMSGVWWALFEACCCYASDGRPKIGDVLRRIRAPAYRTAVRAIPESHNQYSTTRPLLQRSLPNQTPLFNDRVRYLYIISSASLPATKAGIGTSVDLTFLIEGAGSGNGDTRQVDDFPLLH
jgi:hypothetical protein